MPILDSSIELTILQPIELYDKKIPVYISLIATPTKKIDTEFIKDILLCDVKIIINSNKVSMMEIKNNIYLSAIDSENDLLEIADINNWITDIIKSFCLKLQSSYTNEKFNQN